MKPNAILAGIACCIGGAALARPLPLAPVSTTPALESYNITNVAIEGDYMVAIGDKPTGYIDFGLQAA